MSRTQLSDRRPAVTQRVDVAVGTKRVHVLVTYGFDSTGCVKEVFCADFKAGTDLHAIIVDACILISRLLQHGYTPQQLLATLTAPPSLLGCLLAAAPAQVDSVVQLEPQS